MAVDAQGLSSGSNLVFDGGTLYSSGNLTRNIGTAAGEMQFAGPANANEAEFIGGFLGGDSKLTVDWAGTPVWGSTAGFLSTRNGLILNGSQARAQGATGSNALSEVEIAGDFSLGIASGTGKTIAVTTGNSSATGTVTTGDTSGLVVGQSINGPNIASGAYIVSINSATQFTMSANGSAATAINRDVIANNLRAIRVDDNTQTGADFATISGVISAGDSLTGLRKLGGGTLRLTGANTYEGETNVNQGSLAVRSLGLSGSAGTSSVGAVTVAAFTDANAVTLGNGGTSGAILQYIGAGETSDRKIRLNNTTSTTAGAQIHADGSGTLILTNVANDMQPGAKRLYLRGTNNDGNMITSQLSDNGGALELVIDSNATWILTNSANNFTGTTTVSAGALGIGHDTAIGGPS
jgi:autotransporter-associated beta strand protein